MERSGSPQSFAADGLGGVKTYLSLGEIGWNGFSGKLRWHSLGDGNDALLLFLLKVFLGDYSETVNLNA